MRFQSFLALDLWANQQKDRKSSQTNRLLPWESIDFISGPILASYIFPDYKETHAFPSPLPTCHTCHWRKLSSADDVCTKMCHPTQSPNCRHRLINYRQLSHIARFSQLINNGLHTPECRVCVPDSHTSRTARALNLSNRLTTLCSCQRRYKALICR